MTTIAQQIADLVATLNEIKADAGRYWMHCEYAMKVINQIEAEITVLEDDGYSDDELLFGDPNIESKACLDYEARCNYQDDCIEQQDSLELRGPTYRTPLVNDEIPF